MRLTVASWGLTNRIPQSITNWLGVPVILGGLGSFGGGDGSVALAELQELLPLQLVLRLQQRLPVLTQVLLRGGALLGFYHDVRSLPIVPCMKGSQS